MQQALLEVGHQAGKIGTKRVPGTDDAYYVRWKDRFGNTLIAANDSHDIAWLHNLRRVVAPDPLSIVSSRLITILIRGYHVNVALEIESLSRNVVVDDRSLSE
jgi:hypothetical protein